MYFVAVEGLEGESIIGGDDAPPRELTYQVSIKAMTESICGGAILDDYHVITAAHCAASTLDGPLNYPLTVTAGTNDISPDASSSVVPVRVKKIYVPRDYTKQNNLTITHSDLAILKVILTIDFQLSKLSALIFVFTTESSRGH